MEKTIKDRVKDFIEYKGLKMKDFESMCGLSTGYVTSMRKGFGREKLNNVLTAFPDLNRDWLLYGEGEMILNSTNDPPQVVQVQPNRNGILVYDVDATCGKNPRDIDFTDDIVIGSIDLPNISRDCKIIRANGDSMTPKICDGNWIAIREIYDFDDVFYGQIYVVVTNEYRMIKYVRKYEQDEQNYFILRSDNPNYDDITIRKDKIRKMFIVENILSVKIQL